MSSGRTMLSVLVGFLVLAGGCGGPDPGRRPTSLLLISIDTLRPDALGWIGGTNETPQIDRLAATGAAFDAGVASVPLTLPSHTSLMSALDPPRHGVRDNGQVVPADIPTLSEALQGAGFETAAFVSGFPLQAMFGLDRGFELYDDAMPDGEEGWVERKALDTTEVASAWLSETAGPFFAWVHYYDPHDPYEPPRGFWGPGERGAYHGEVQLVDHAIAKLLDAIPAESRDDTLIVLVADHGEALGDHEEVAHGYFVYDSTMTVPIIFHWPAGLSPLRSSAPIRMIDVMPTCLELLGIPAPAAIDGESLVAGLRSGEIATSPAYMESRLPWIYFGWSPLSALRDGRWKVIDAPRPELYDIVQDPLEATDLFEERTQLGEGLLMDLRELGSGSRAVESVTDEVALEALRSLGYVGAGNSVGEPGEGLDDPKDRVQDRVKILDAEGLLRRGDWNAAIVAFESLLATDPDSRAATLRSGVALLRLGRLEEAVERLERATELDPDRAEGRFALGAALMQSERHDRAILQWMELARIQPRRLDAWVNLGISLLLTGEFERAEEALDHAVALDVQDAETRQRLALTLVAAARRLPEPSARKTVASALTLHPALGPALEADADLAPLLAAPATQESTVGTD